MTSSFTDWGFSEGIRIAVPKRMVLGVALLVGAVGPWLSSPQQTRSTTVHVPRIAASAPVQMPAPAPAPAPAPPPCAGEECEGAEEAMATPDTESDAKAPPLTRAWATARDQAREHYRRGRFDRAAAAYRRASKLRPSDPLAYAGLGGSLLAGGDERAAAVAYRKAIQRAPGNSRYREALGVALFRGGDMAGARQSFERALRLDPTNQSAADWYGRIP